MKQDCNGSEVAPADRRDIASLGLDRSFGDPDTTSPDPLFPAPDDRSELVCLKLHHH